MVKDIKPEDIEDYTDRFTSYFGVEFEADTVKKIHIRNENGEKSEIFLISLIEHKTEVDYNVVIHFACDLWNKGVRIYKFKIGEVVTKITASPKAISQNSCAF